MFETEKALRCGMEAIAGGIEVESVIRGLLGPVSLWGKDQVAVAQVLGEYYRKHYDITLDENIGDKYV